MKKPVLAVMAAGMGSRYGGLKQMDPVDEFGHVILDYSVYDAAEAGFEKVIFIIKRENEEDFRFLAEKSIAGRIAFDFAYQELDDIPEGFLVPEGRVKPWGTAHAVRSLRRVLKDEAFVVINADDYYGKKAFSLIFDNMCEVSQAPEKEQYAFVAYEVGKTVTENGSVARGICCVDENDILQTVTERTNIVKREDGAAFSEDQGATWTFLPGDTPVSMNFWGFPYGFLARIEEGFPAFLEKGLREDPLKCECYLPALVESLIDTGAAQVKTLYTPDQWHGVTYKDDKPELVAALKKLREGGYYRF